MKNILVFLIPILVSTIISCAGQAVNNAIRVSDLQETTDARGNDKTILDQNGSQRFREGRIIVKFRRNTDLKTKDSIIKMLKTEIIKQVGTDLYLLKIPGNSSVKEMINRLQQFKEVEYSEPDYSYSIN